MALALALGDGARESGGLTLEFAEDGFFVVEEVTDEAVGMPVF